MLVYLILVIGAAHAVPGKKICPIERGFCVHSNGTDQNSGVIKLDNIDGNTPEVQASCLERCLRHKGSTGCEVIWDQDNRGCYVHTKTVAKGNGVDRHMCWIFAKCKANTESTTFPAKRSYKDEHVTMFQGNNIAKFSQLGTQFSVSFDFVPSRMHEDGAWSSVFHMTNTSSTCCGTGTRMASVWFRQVDSVNYLHVCTDIGGKLRQYYEPESSIKVGKKVSIRIAQNRFGDHYEFSISVNCRLVWGEVNPLPQVVPNIVLYTGNRDCPVQEGLMSNLEVMSD